MLPRLPAARLGGGAAWCSDQRQKGTTQYADCRNLSVGTHLTSEHHAARNLGFRDKVRPPWDHLIGVASLAVVYGGLVAWWTLTARSVQLWTALVGFLAVTVGAGLAVGTAYALEGVRDKWRRLEEKNRRQMQRIDELSRERGDGQHRQSGIGGAPVGDATAFLDDVGDRGQKLN
jgi:hypothetical protein